MACACQNGTKAPTSYVHTSPGGKKTVYRTEVEANTAKASQGGTVKPQ